MLKEKIWVGSWMWKLFNRKCFGGFWGSKWEGEGRGLGDGCILVREVIGERVVVGIGRVVDFLRGRGDF